MLHGSFAGSNLVEGNNGPCGCDVDSTCGRNGPYNTWYRNRATGSGDIETYNADKSENCDNNPPCVNVPPAIFGNWIGNTADRFYAMLGSHIFDSRLQYAWIERNVVRTTFSLAPNPTTSCGTDSGEPDCPGTNREGFDNPDPSSFPAARQGYSMKMV